MRYDPKKYEIIDNSNARVYYNGYKKISKQGVEFEIIGKIKTKKGKKAKYLIKFKSSDNAFMVTNALGINKAELRDLNFKTLHDIGYLGYGEHKSVDKNIQTKEYKLWNRVITRCYSEKSKESRPTYKDVTVEERWHCFQNFCEDLPSIKGYENWINDESEGRCNIEFDKDILCEKLNINPKVYSRDTCMFVTQAENLEQSSKTGHTYKAIRLSDEYEEIFYNQRKFSRKYELEHTCVAECCRLDKTVSIHKGWQFSIVEK